MGSCSCATFLVTAALLCGCQRRISESTERAVPAWTSLGPGVSVQRTDRTDPTNANVTWWVVRVDLQQATLQAEAPRDNRLEALGRESEKLFAVNAGFFEPDLRPTGLLVSEGTMHAAWKKHGGSGVLVVERGMARIDSAAPGDLSGVSLAVQCGPRLVEPGGIVGMHGDDGKRAARTVACVRRGGHELNFVLAFDGATAMDGPTLFQTATWLVAPLAAGDSGGCEAALNLDGGPSTGFVAATLKEVQWRQPAGPVPWAIVASARKN